jgi:large subunit ribosomal protein L23
MDSTYIIKKPILTEKSTAAMNEEARYTFEVDRRASKNDVKRAVEQLYGVKVEGVTTQVRKGGERRLKYGWVTDKVTKKATVRLAEGQVIELF